MASFLKHPSVKELAHITSKGVFSSQNQSKHTHKCSLWDQRGREFLKAGHKLIVFLTVPCSQRSGQILPGLYLRLTTPRNKPGWELAPDPSRETLREQETACAWRMKHWKPHKNRRRLVFRWSKRCREKPYSVVLNKIHNNVTFTFVPRMSFWTQRLGNMLDSQALAFKVTFHKSFIHFFSTNIYGTNSAKMPEIQRRICAWTSCRGFWK